MWWTPEVLTQGIPYQDYFYTAHRYCILGLARNKARLQVSHALARHLTPGWSQGPLPFSLSESAPRMLGCHPADEQKSGTPRGG